MTDVRGTKPIGCIGHKMQPPEATLSVSRWVKKKRQRLERGCAAEQRIKVVGRLNGLRQRTDAVDAAVLDERLATEFTAISDRLTALGVPLLFHTRSASKPVREVPTNCNCVQADAATKTGGGC
jgi:hypothetical protein